MYIRYCVIEFIYGVFAFWNSQQPVSAPVPHGLSDFLYEDEEVIDERKWIEYWDKWTPNVFCLLLSEASIEPIEVEVEVLLSEEMPDSAHLFFCMADEEVLHKFMRSLYWHLDHDQMSVIESYT
ncbi:hypothetical protein LXL04_019156 [Taraxacum kok-saghyz]